MQTATAASTLPETGFVRLPAILAVFPVGASTWWRMVRDGRAPKPVKLGPATTAWRAEDIRELIADCAKKRPPGNGNGAS